MPMSDYAQETSGRSTVLTESRKGRRPRRPVRSRTRAIIGAVFAAACFAVPAEALAQWTVECAQLHRHCVAYHEQDFGDAPAVPLGVVRLAFLRSSQTRYLLVVTASPVSERGLQFSARQDVDLAIPRTKPPRNMKFAGCVRECTWFLELSDRELQEILSAQTISYGFQPVDGDIGAGWPFPREGLKEAIERLDKERADSWGPPHR
jgi:hypothetical protein